MPDTKISAAADPGTLVATDKLPLARSASTTAYAATVAEIATYANAAYAPNYYTGSPAMDGTAAPGSVAFVSRGDHRHPTDVSLLSKSGGTMTGTLTLAADPAAALQAATKQYVDAAAAGVTAGVDSFNTRTGAVTLSSADVTTALTFTPYNATNPSGYQTAAQVTAVLPVVNTATTPLVDGTAAIGALTTYARPDHVHPTDTSRYAATNPSGYQTAAQVTTALAAGQPGAFSTLTATTLTATTSTVTASPRETSVAMAANAIDLNLGSVFTKTISGATTLTISNAPATGNVVAFILELTNPSTSVTWFAGVKWAGGTAPTLTTTGLDILGFYSRDGGTNWRGTLLAKDSK